MSRPRTQHSDPVQCSNLGRVIQPVLPIRPAQLSQVDIAIFIVNLSYYRFFFCFFFFFFFLQVVSIFYSRTVSKEGPNKGRPFYCCAKPRGQGCDFFEWGDTPGPSATSNRFKTTISAPTNTGAAKKRKCGLCHQEGGL